MVFKGIEENTGATRTNFAEITLIDLFINYSNLIDSSWFCPIGAGLREGDKPMPGRRENASEPLQQPIARSAHEYS